MFSKNGTTGPKKYGTTYVIDLSPGDVAPLSRQRDQRTDPEVLSDLFPTSHDDYEWFDEKNRQQFLEYVPGMVVAQGLDIEKQVELYKERIADVVAKDRADRVAWLIGQRTGYHGLCHRHPRPLPKKTFSVPIGDLTRFASHSHRSERVRREWRFVRLKAYGEMVPTHAFEALQLLQQHDIQPEGLWVAKKVEVVERPRRLPDPLLCVSFGRWVVAIAEWI